MNVLLVCPLRLKTDKTGDATQARETERALLAGGHSVRRLYVDGWPLDFIDENGLVLTREQVCDCIKKCDVIHQLPTSKILTQTFSNFPRKPTVGSTIFWGGWERVVTIWKTVPSKRQAWRKMMWEVHNMLPSRMGHYGVDVYLPNSRAEGERVMRCYGHESYTRFCPVPNGFVPPHFDIWSLPRSSKAPDCDYVVVPGVFAYRKNQLSLIRSLRGTPFQIVFLGGVINDDYYKACKRVATSQMHFIGYSPSDSEEYWKILRHARVACLPSDCETPGIAMIEAAYAGARPAITKFGGTREYYGECAEYLNPCFNWSIRRAVCRAWRRGRLDVQEASSFKRFSWQLCAEKTIEAYKTAINDFYSRQDSQEA